MNRNRKIGRFGVISGVIALIIMFAFIGMTDGGYGTDPGTASGLAFLFAFISVPLFWVGVHYLRLGSEDKKTETKTVVVPRPSDPASERRIPKPAPTPASSSKLMGDLARKGSSAPAAGPTPVRVRPKEREEPVYPGEKESLDQKYASEHGGWICPRCETLNEGTQKECIVCGHLAP